MIDDRNNKFRGWNLTGYDHKSILDMINGIIPNNLFIGDYVIINKIAYRFAKFYDNKCAVLVPDRIIGRSQNSFGKFTVEYEKSYIHKTVLPRLLQNFSMTEFPVIETRLLNETDLYTLPLFNLDKSFIKEYFNTPYLLSDIANKYSYRCVDEFGRVSDIPAGTYLGIRPKVYIGNTIFLSNKK